MRRLGIVLIAALTTLMLSLFAVFGPSIRDGPVTALAGLVNFSSISGGDVLSSSTGDQESVTSQAAATDQVPRAEVFQNGDLIGDSDDSQTAWYGAAALTDNALVSFSEDAGKQVLLMVIAGGVLAIAATGFVRQRGGAALWHSLKTLTSSAMVSMGIILASFTVLVATSAPVDAGNGGYLGQDSAGFPMWTLVALALGSAALVGGGLVTRRAGK